MITARMIMGLAIASLVVTGAGTALGAAPVTQGSAAPVTPERIAPEPAPATVWLKGAFGRVPGGPLHEPATAAPDGRALDAWMRRAPLELTTDLPAQELTRLSVVAQAVTDEPVLRLSSSATDFEGPDVPGRYVLVATIETERGGDAAFAWLVEVPDRSGGPELLWQIPGPTAALSAAGGAVQGVPGHGCYAYLCVEAGHRPPPATLEPLRVGVGETPILGLDDGSAMVHWKGQLRPLEGTEAVVREAAAGFDEPQQATPKLVGLEPTIAGEWLLEVRADYDRERGWQWFLFRLVAE